MMNFDEHDDVATWYRSRLQISFAQFEPGHGRFILNFFILGTHGGRGVRVLVKNGVSTALCGAHETSLFKFCIKNYIES